MTLTARLAVPATLLCLAVLAGCASTPLPASAPISSPPPPAAPVDAAAVALPPPATPQPAAPAAADTRAAAEAPAVDPLNPDVRLDLEDRAAQEDLWDRVRRGFAMPDLDSERVRASERWYAARPDYVQRMTERGSRYLFHIVEEVEKRGMPTELALLPFIESAFNPQAMSSAKASGMWQFIPSTGRDFDLRQNVFRDDRRDVLASTRAALDYLERLHGMFGDWHLALAAYNWGEGSVQRAIKRNEKLGLPTDYQSLRMPEETAGYVPKLQSVKNIVARPADFNLALPALANHPYFVAVGIERDIDVEVAARLAQLPLDEFKALNPQMNKPVILAAGTPQVLLPYDNANLFVRALKQHRGALASWTAWVAPKTIAPADAARQVGMAESQLREVNRIPGGMLIKSGSVLLVPRTDHRADDVAEHIADNATIALAPVPPPLRKLAVKAGRKESVASVAKRYRVSPADVARWNGVTTASNFKPGQALVVYVAAKGGTRAAAAEADDKPVVSRKAVARAKATGAQRAVARSADKPVRTAAKKPEKSASPRRAADAESRPSAKSDRLAQR